MLFKFLQAKLIFGKTQESKQLDKQAEFLFELEHELFQRNWIY